MGAPGMHVVLEVLAKDNLKPFGLDGLDSRSQVILLHPEDSERVLFGPVVVSWNSRLLQVPIFIVPNAPLGPVPFYIFSIATGRFSDTISFTIAAPQHLGPITHDVTIGGGFGQLSAGNTLLVDSLIVTGVTVHFSVQDPDPTIPGNPRLQPVTLLSNGPVRLTNATISVDADSLDGGPGGGGGGHGFPGAGGMGFTGGGSSSDTTLTNTGSAADATLTAGGACATGVVGGGSEQGDQGGGGGTGAPYGASGAAGVGALNSPAGGFGGGSGGGEATNPFIEYGGGGGGFGTSGRDGLGGSSANGGNANGGRFLVPLAGGSGGGSGNSVELGDSTRGGSGGGGGGAMELVGFDSIVMNGSMLYARGDSGTRGTNIAAGGGGGSGGAIYLASPEGIRTANTHPIVSGGNGGAGNTDPLGNIIGFPGGTGGLGRIRIDGPTNLTPDAVVAPIWSNGISLAPSRLVPEHGFVQLSGVAQDTINTLDSVRIYYRTRHTAWQFVDTLRASNGSWSKWIALSHDSLIFASAMVEVSNPANGNNNPSDYEPSWLVSTASLSLIHHPASPFLVSPDTLNFGTVRIGRCKTLTLRIANNGEEPLVLAKGTFSGTPGFSIVPESTVTILPYTADTFEVEFCPPSAGTATGKLSFASNDSAGSPKIITLLGIGVARKDSLLLVPDSLRFDRVLIDSCATDTITLKSVGSDTLYLGKRLWSLPPFTLRLVPPDTALAPGATRKLLVTFCPTDSGNFAATQVLDERGDSIVIRGRGVLRRAASIPTINVGTLCLAQAGTAFDTISNLGNDTISVFAFQGQRIPRKSVGLLLDPNAHNAIVIPIPADSLGIFADTVSFELADTTLTTLITYRVVGSALSIAPRGEVQFFACVGGCGTDTITIASQGLDTLVLSMFHVSAPFTLLDSYPLLLPGEVDTLRLSFCPDTFVYFDTLHFLSSAEGCDSVIAVALHGTGIITGLATEPVTFDSTLVGGCSYDSMFVSNPCGPATVIDSVSNSNADFHLVSPQPDTIPPNGTIKLLFQFCPTMVGTESDTAVLFLHDGSSLRETLAGVGIARVIPWAHFTISDTIVRMGDQAVSSIRLDSSSLKGRHAIRAVVSFDPTVLSPAPSFPNPITSAGIDSETFSDTIDFGTPSFLEAIIWNTLAGPLDSSSVGLTVTTDTPIKVIVNNGSVTLTDCFGLAGHLASSGSYALGPITPNPSASEASATMTLGSDGYVEAAIYDMAGRLVQTLLQQRFTRGSYQLTIPTNGLSSGRYMLEINSMGWRAAAPFVMDR